MDLDLRRKQHAEMKKNNPYIAKLVSISNDRCIHVIPQLILASLKVTNINPYCPNPPEYWEITPNLTTILNPTSNISFLGGGDWEFYVRATKQGHFHNRQEFEDVVLEKTRSCFGQVLPKAWKAIPITEAFKHIGVTLKLNLENVLTSATEEKKDQFETQRWMYGQNVAEQKVLKSFLLQIFGPPATGEHGDSGDQLEFIDFNCYFEGGNFCQGTAKYGEKYIYMAYATS